MRGKQRGMNPNRCQQATHIGVYGCVCVQREIHIQSYDYCQRQQARIKAKEAKETELARNQSVSTLGFLVAKRPQ